MSDHEHVERASPAQTDTTSIRGLVIGLVVGVPIIAYGIRGALIDAEDTEPRELAGWFVRWAVLHDLLVAPILLLVGYAVSRLVRDNVVRAILRGALLVSAGLALVAYPLVRGYGRTPRVPSALARDYGTGLTTYLAITWLVAIALIIVHRARGRIR
jgi:hypothetical protein